MSRRAATPARTPTRTSAAAPAVRPFPPLSPDDPARPLAVVERAHREWGLRYEEIAQALGADESTLHRWRAGATRPSRAFQGRLAALSTLMAVVARECPTEAGARQWLETPAVPFGGYTPRALLATGRTELLLALLTVPGAMGLAAHQPA